MTKHQPPRLAASCARWLCACASVVALFCVSAAGQVAPGSPVLLTEGTGTTTRGVAFEAVTHASEPFTVVSPYNWNADKSNNSDQRTRLMLFAMNLELLAGEGANALTADALDASGRVYSLKVESLARPVYVQLGPAPGNPLLQIPIETPQHWLYSIVVRLNDEMVDNLGDVLISINLHGLRSNRVRVRLGQNTGGPAVDPLIEYPAPAPAVPPPPTPTPTPKPYGPGQATSADVVRLLDQATWGATSAEVTRVQAMGLRAFLDEQFAVAPLNPAKGSDYPDLAFPLDDVTQQCPAGSPQECNRDNYTLYPIQRTFFTNALNGQGQLRGRVAFALHQIFVVSGRDLNRPSWMTVYLQALDRGAFGNFRTLLNDITLNPSMGEYLDMRLSTRTNPNENFAREVLQLFSIGVNELNPDGTPKLDSQGDPIPSYNQTHVNEFTRVLTGWNLTAPIAAGITNFRDPMVPRGGTTHDTGAKTLLNGAIVPACPQGTPNATCAQNDLTAALDNIFNHPNVGPFIGRQLIQHLVTSNPSPAYVERVAATFNDDCAGLYPETPCSNTRGNMKAVVRAVLLDSEARGDVKTAPSYGRLREPVQYMTNVMRAFDARSFDKTSTSDGVLASRSSTDFTGLMDQQLFAPPTVFSYYQPDYEVPGTKILGPAFGILSTTTTLRRANFVNTIVYTGVAPTTTTTDRPRGTSLDLAPLEALATNDTTGALLVERLNSLLMHGTMSAQVRASVTGAVLSIPTTDANFARKRAQMAAYLVATSSQYDVQR